MKGRTLEKHKGDMGIGSMLVMIITLMVAIILIMAYTSWHSKLAAQDSIYLTVGTYLKSIESSGCLTEDQKEQLIQSGFLHRGGYPAVRDFFWMIIAVRFHSAGGRRIMQGNRLERIKRSLFRKREGAVEAVILCSVLFLCLVGITVYSLQLRTAKNEKYMVDNFMTAK